MARKELLEYVWNTQIIPQIGYSFSRLHSTGYSLIALQEMNLAHLYPPIYWQAACLAIQAGADEDNENNKGTDYGKIATAIGNMQQRGIKVTLPDINKAGFGFTPDPQNNAIIFGLKGINGINDDLCKIIIENRPYTSFMDFYNRMVKTKIVKHSQMIQLIKAGCFDSLSPDRVETMRQYLKLTIEPKTKLSLANFKSIIEHGIVPEKYKLYVRFFRYKDYISKNVYKTIDKPKDRLLLLDDIATQFYHQHFSEEPIVDVVNGNLVISEKKFKKEYDEKMEVIKEWLQSDELLKEYNDAIFQEAWDTYAYGSISSWEMESVCYYSSSHELINVNNEKYGIVNFFDLSEEPKPIRLYEWKGRQIPEYELYRIAGTVLDKDKIRHTVSLLTVYGVVTVKFNPTQFAFYDRSLSEVENGKKNVVEGSWFKRGNKLLVTGFRRENQFIAKRYKDSVYTHTLVLIEDVKENGDLVLKLEREQVG